mmetsp:Transcript_20003/g.37761  ORF Transcript_20003/g.37761 Transcript_20003/m.37761 type:complete len:197 (+) Transcript_20003:18-608(+)
MKTHAASSFPDSTMQANTLWSWIFALTYGYDPLQSILNHGFLMLGLPIISIAAQASAKPSVARLCLNLLMICAAGLQAFAIYSMHEEGIGLVLTTLAGALGACALRDNICNLPMHDSRRSGPAVYGLGGLLAVFCLSWDPLERGALHVFGFPMRDVLNFSGLVLGFAFGTLMEQFGPLKTQKEVGFQKRGVYGIPV